MKLERWVYRLSMVLVVVMPLTLACLYFANPFGARSHDPRQRIIGHAPYRIVSESMLPTLQPGQIVIMRAGYYRKHEPQRGEIVVYLNPGDRNPWVHRVIGLPGENIAIEDGVLLINGRKQVEDYVEPAYTTSDYSWEMPAQDIPENSYFLMGDNRDNSADGRMTGPVPRDDLTGKVVAVLNP